MKFSTDPTSSIGRRSSLAVKLSLIVLASTSVIFFAAFSVTYVNIRGMMLENAESKARKLAIGTANEIYATLNAVMAIAEPAGAVAEKRWIEEANLHELLDEIVMRSEYVSGAAIAFEPYSIREDERYYAPFSYVKDGELRRTYLGGDELHYFVRDWYQIPREARRPVWTDPFRAEGGADEMIATYAIPLYRDHEDPESFFGVMALDISLENVFKMIESISIFESGFAFLVSSSGAFVTYPDSAFVRRESFFSLADEWDLPQLREIGRGMVRDGEGFVSLPPRLIGDPAWMYYTPLPAADWTLAVVVPEHELFGDILRLIRLVLLIGGVGFVVLLVVIVGVTRSITMPLKRLVATASEISRGNLDEVMPPAKSNDEVGELSRSFDEMRVNLKDYINNLTETTKAKERIESELVIARNIQMSFLPKKYALPASVTEVDLHAKLVSAKHVGGDLYDFFLLKDRYLYFAVGDVSDKGVPAALFMAVTKTLVKGIAEQYEDPGDILFRVNNELCTNNDAGMFVTYVCGLLDLKTGELSVGNAGHNLPLLRRRGRAPEWLSLDPGLVLGAMEDVEFPVRKIMLHPGDRILFYTDGVVEAANEGEELLGDDTLLELFGQLDSKTPKDAVGSVFSTVESHSGDAPQTDDITVLVLDYTGVSKDASRPEKEIFAQSS